MRSAVRIAHTIPAKAAQPNARLRLSPDRRDGNDALAFGILATRPKFPCINRLRRPAHGHSALTPAAILAILACAHLMQSLRFSAFAGSSMPVAQQTDLRAYCVDLARRAQAAAIELASVSGAARNDFLKTGARLLRERTDDLLAANRQDVAAAPSFQLSDAQLDRLRLTPKTIESMAVALEEVAAQADPIGEVIE